MKILLADKLSPIVRHHLQEHTILEIPTLKGDELLQTLIDEQPNILVVRSTKVTTEHLEAATSLSLIIRAGAGVNTIDLFTASQRGIFVANCPGRNAIAVAELVMGHTLNWNRHLYENIRDFRQGVWNKKTYGKSPGLLGQTIAIFGVGSIGKEVIQRAKAFGLNIQCWSRSLTKETAKTLGVQFCSTPLEAATGADILSVHLPAVSTTKHFINKDILNSMNDGGLVINTSRNSLLDEAALVQAIEEKGLSAGLDVFDGEPASSDKEVSSLLCEKESVYVTHHIGASTNQATESVAEAVIEIVDVFVQTGEILNCVNIQRKPTASTCLSIRHADKVGVLAHVFDTLKTGGHNVQEMENIIFDGGKSACARIFIGDVPSQNLIEQLESYADIYACSFSSIQS